MENIDFQALINAVQSLEQRVTALQGENNLLRQEQAQHQQQVQAAAAAAAAAGQAAAAAGQLNVAGVIQPASKDRIPDPIKFVPSYDGNKKTLNNWIHSAETALNLYRNDPRVTPEVFSVYEQTLVNKIEGKARETVCVNSNNISFNEAKTLLLTIYGDKNDIATYQTQLWGLKMDESLHNYYKKSKEIMQCIKNIARAKTLYRDHWEAINDFIDNECLTGFINGLRKPYFNYAQTAQPENLESAYAFCCKFQNAENMQIQTHKRPDKKFSNHQQQQRFDNNSTKFKVTPMEVDPSMRSKMKINVNNQNTEEKSEEIENSDSENSENNDFLEETNFQICHNNQLTK